MTSTYTETVKSRIRAWGADKVGVADTEPLRALRVDPPDLLAPFSRALAIAIRLPVAVFESIADRPTPIYSNVYQIANRLLDELAFRSAVSLQNDGYSSLPVPASQVLDRENFYGAISHKAVARMAGIGWQGKNLLLITPEYGSRVRLVTVLTDAPLEVDGPVKNRCGKCTACQEACPAGAIRGLPTESHYASRNEALEFSKCADLLTGRFAGLPHIGAPICGICIKACPFGRKKAERPASG